jgi:hypothetical protein
MYSTIYGYLEIVEWAYNTWLDIGFRKSMIAIIAQNAINNNHVLILKWGHGIDPKSLNIGVRMNWVLYRGISKKMDFLQKKIKRFLSFYQYILSIKRYSFLW